MTRCSIKPRDQIYVKSYGFLSFAMSRQSIQLRYVRWVSETS